MTVPDVEPVSSLPVPIDGEVALLLQTVWDLLVVGDHWPSYRMVDRVLHRERGLDIEAVLVRTPETLLRHRPASDGTRPDPGIQLGLSVAGAAACHGSEQALAVLVMAARLAAQAEREAPLASEDPAVTFAAAGPRAGVKLAGPDAHQVARQSGLLLDAEP
jgi:hypothetical protein